nr:immunoglobulin heavy chain junction region [Macaca mulatta]
CVRAQSNFDCW